MKDLFVFDSTLQLLSSLTEEIIKASGEKQDDEETWVEEATGSLLDTWTCLLQVRSCKLFSTSFV